jgi:multidrug efflux system membrane fusion protein
MSRFATLSPALLALALACGSEAAPPPPPPVTVAPAVARQVTDWDDFTGQLEAVDRVEVRPRVSGHIQRVAFREGSEVRAGDVLFVIDPRPYATELARAAAERERSRTRLALAVSELERAEKLAAVQAISREELDTKKSAVADSRAALDVSESAVADARLDLEWTRIRSPIAGRVGRAAVTEGNLVEVGAPAVPPLTTVVSVDQMRVSFETDERTFLKYAELMREGTRPSARGTASPVRMGLASEPGYPHEGRLDFVDNHVDAATGTIRVRAVFSNAERQFTPGLFARVRLEGGEARSVTLVPDRAIGTDQDRKFVLVLKADSTVDYRGVQLGRLIEGMRVIEGGLKPGEQIVVSGTQRARPGTKVTAMAEQPDSSTVATAR